MAYFILRVGLKIRSHLYNIIICLAGLSHKIDLCVGQKNSAFISGNAEWNSTSSEETEMHVWCWLAFLITEKSCFSPLLMRSLYPIQRGDYIPISIPFSNCFCFPLANGKLRILYDHQVWERGAWTCITYNSSLDWTIDLAVKWTFQRGVTPSFTSSIQSSRQLADSPLNLNFILP